LTKEQIEKMVKEAELLKEEDERNMKRVEAKNKLENYIYNWRNQMDNAEITSKLATTDVEQVQTCVKETQTWLDQNNSASTEEFESKYTECETQLKSVAMKLYASGAGASGAAGTSGAGTSGAGTSRAAEVEEVD